LYVAKQAQIAMAGGDSIEMLVVLGNHKENKLNSQDLLSKIFMTAWQAAHRRCPK